MEKILQKYAKKVNEIYADSQSTPELSYRTAFHLFLEECFEFLNQKNIRVIQEGKGIKQAGKPDFFLKDKISNLTTSYIETKSINSEEIEIGDFQIERYVKNLELVCTTDYCSFSIFKNGRKEDSVKILHLRKKTFEIDYTKTTCLENILKSLVTASTRKSIGSEELAISLAKRGRLIKEMLEEIVDSRKPESSKILKAFEFYQRSLNPESTLKEFLSNYSQCLTYGLFVAKIENPSKEVIKSKIENSLPKNQKILKTLFSFLGEKSLVGQKINWVLDDICTYLNAIDIEKIRKEFDYTFNKQDPVIYFYETFIKYFDPEEKSLKGIYYTPDPIVDYIVNSVDKLLRGSGFDKKIGLASNNVTVLDPAAGTSTFLIKALLKAYSNMQSSSNQGRVGKQLLEHVLPNFYGMEILLAPYVVSHLKISRILEDLVVDNKQETNFNLMLTNTLSVKEGRSGELPFMKELYEENKKALKVKKETPILVIIGNPPYSVSSSSTGNDFIDKLIQPYKEMSGKKEQNIRALTNDYVKFLRWSEWKIEQNDGLGIVGMITSNSYLSGVNFRGMRKHLLKSFDKIYILNLHGDSRVEINESDENVFDIKEGVSIIFGIKDKTKTTELGKLFYKDLVGSRNYKYEHLRNNDLLSEIEFKELTPVEPYFVFKPFEMDTECPFTTNPGQQIPILTQPVMLLNQILI